MIKTSYFQEFANISGINREIHPGRYRASRSPDELGHVPDRLRAEYTLPELLCDQGMGCVKRSAKSAGHAGEVTSRQHNAMVNGHGVIDRRVSA